MCDQCDAEAVEAGQALDHLMMMARDMTAEHPELSASQGVSFMHTSIIREMAREVASGNRDMREYIMDVTLILSVAVTRLNAVQDIHGVSFT